MTGVPRRDVLRLGALGGAGVALGGSGFLMGRRQHRADRLPPDALPVRQVEQWLPRVDAGNPVVGSRPAPASGDGLSVASARSVASEHDIAAFSLIAVRVAEVTHGTLRLRCREQGVWGPWIPLEVGHEELPDGARPDPGWAPPVLCREADAYEVELPDGSVAVPEVRLVRESDEPLGPATVPASANFAPQPAIMPRSAWNAAAPLDDPDVADTLEVAFVHHTVSSNSYSQSQAPQQVRNIQAYHLSRTDIGYIDIAYNFLVDRFGTIWEGRAGGVARPVISGATFGHNTRSVSISYLGSLVDGVTLPPAAEQAIAALAAWKLGLHGVDPASTTSYTSYSGDTKTLRTISGHGDVGQTACPGNAQQRLPAIRDRARYLQRPFPDVGQDAFYFEPVVWAVLAGITTGVGDTGRFQPDATLSRGQAATFIHRMMDRLPPTARHSFWDVAPDTFYDVAVSWMSEQGITTGVGGGSTYQPDGVVTRGQMSTFLHRIAGEPAAVEPAGFDDVVPGAFYGAAVDWMAEHRITTGVAGSNRFAPDDPVTRGEMVTFMYRLASTAAAWAAPAPSTVRF